MKVISFVAQKGGVGKSTLAISCAVAAYQQGQNVLILDMDPQGSVESWYQDRSEDTPGVVCITAPKIEQAISAAAERGFDLIVIDTPGRDAPGIAAAIKVSDLVIIPCRPSVTDMKAIPATFAMVHRLNKQAAFVLSQTPVATLARGSRIREAEAGLSMLGMAAPVPIVSRLAYQDAHGLGLGVTEYEPNGKAAAEITRLWKWITTKLEKTTDETTQKNVA